MTSASGCTARIIKAMQGGAASAQQIAAEKG